MQLPPSNVAKSLATLEGQSEAVVTVLCTPDDGCGWHPIYVEWTCRIINDCFVLYLVGQLLTYTICYWPHWESVKDFIILQTHMNLNKKKKRSFLDYFTIKWWKHSLSSFETSPKIYCHNILEDLNLQRNFCCDITKVPKFQICRVTLGHVFILGSKRCDILRNCRRISKFGAEYSVSVFRVMLFVPWRWRQCVFYVKSLTIYCSVSLQITETVCLIFRPWKLKIQKKKHVFSFKRKWKFVNYRLATREGHICNRLRNFLRSFAVSNTWT